MSVTAKCTSCGATTNAAVDVARAAGWRIWDGQSVTGKDIQARVCPVCAGGRDGEEPPKAEAWRVGCRTCDWEFEDEYNEGPLTEKDARSMASDHECEPDTWVKPPETLDERVAAEARMARARVARMLVTP